MKAIEAAVRAAIGDTHIETGRTDDYEALVARLTAALDWQPIETAPKDGTPFLVYEASDGERWPEYNIAFCKRGEAYVFQRDEHLHVREDARWMPLPEPSK